MRIVSRATASRETAPRATEKGEAIAGAAPRKRAAPATGGSPAKMEKERSSIMGQTLPRNGSDFQRPRITLSAYE